MSAPGRVLAVLALTCVARGAGAQAARPADAPKECNLELHERTLPGHPPTSYNQVQTSPGMANKWLGGGVDARCVNTDQRILSDSAEQFDDQHLLHLIGNVHYTEKRVALDADRLTYFMQEERLVAEGNVHGLTSTGTRFTAPRAEYWRVKLGVRDRSRLEASPRPDVWLSPADAGSGSKDSVHVVANQFISDNDSLMYARGKVVIDRPDLTSTSDSAFLDNGKEVAQLRLEPRVVGRGDRKFTLEGQSIDIYSRNREAERVRSNGKAKATSDEVNLASDSIDLRIAGQKLSRATAWGPGRARATQPSRDITADSIDVLMPGQQLREIHAVRRALAEGYPDTTKIKSREKDWLKGDTIVAHFDTAATNDTAKAAIRRIDATGSAASYQQLQHSGAVGRDSTPTVSYVTGKAIQVHFDSTREIQRVDVKGQVSGVYIEPVPDSLRAKRADSTARKSGEQPGPAKKAAPPPLPKKP